MKLKKPENMTTLSALYDITVVKLGGEWETLKEV